MSDGTFFRLIGILRWIGVAGLGNFGIGSPRKMPPFLAVLRFIIALLNPWGYGYAEKQGRLQTRKALAWNLRKTLGAIVTPAQMLLLEGSKPAIRYILQALELVGEVVLPMPFYPGNKDGVLGAGCTAVYVPMNTVREFIQLLRAWLEDDPKFRPVAVVLSFDNPRWLQRSVEEYAELVALALKYKFILISDEAYRELSYEGKVCSLLQVEGWYEVGFVIQTGSKPVSMAGSKLGAVIAPCHLIGTNKTPGPIMKIKSRDSEGGSPAAQKAWATALRWCSGYPARIGWYYQRQYQFMVDEFRRYVGPELLEIQESHGGMFLYVKPLQCDVQKLLELFTECGFDVSPGENFGQPGKIRWCLNQPWWVTQRAVRRFCGLLINLRV